MSEGLDKAVNIVRDFFMAAEERINAVVPTGKTIASTKLAEEVGNQFGIDQQQGYHLLSIYVEARSEELRVKLGKGGGIAATEAYLAKLKVE
jgi:hypothetical protein